MSRWLLAATTSVVALVLVCLSPAPALGGSARASTWLAPGSPPLDARGFRRKRSSITSRVGPAHHSAVDVLSRPGDTVHVEGKFAYGAVSKDLEKEDVTLWILRAKRWRKVVTVRTDDDGRARFQIPGAWLDRPGAHHVAMVVQGDATMARSVIWVLPTDREVVIFDIDGTLTTGDGELVVNVLTNHEVAMRPAANRLAHHYRQRGILPVYVTGRPYMLNLRTKRWLSRRGFPLGPLVTTRKIGESLPTAGGVGRFKARWLAAQIRRVGVVVRAAYGNARTDVCAFAKAGIAPTATFIVGKHGGRSCPGYRPSIAIGDFALHLGELERATSAGDGAATTGTAGPAR